MHACNVRFYRALDTCANCPWKTFLKVCKLATALVASRLERILHVRGGSNREASDIFPGVKIIFCSLLLAAIASKVLRQWFCAVCTHTGGRHDLDRTHFQLPLCWYFFLSPTVHQGYARERSPHVAQGSLRRHIAATDDVGA